MPVAEFWQAQVAAFGLALTTHEKSAGDVVKPKVWIDCFEQPFRARFGSFLPDHYHTLSSMTVRHDTNLAEWSRRFLIVAETAQMPEPSLKRVWQNLICTSGNQALIAWYASQGGTVAQQAQALQQSPLAHMRRTGYSTAAAATEVPSHDATVKELVSFVSKLIA